MTLVSVSASSAVSSSGFLELCFPFLGVALALALLALALALALLAEALALALLLGLTLRGADSASESVRSASVIGGITAEEAMGGKHVLITTQQLE